jgi:1-aminocyclopropane-1-carboxylate deaminase/D-cysteine desulfhydrase-like pyridoxal-dependent ACC family enzyme
MEAQPKRRHVQHPLDEPDEPVLHYSHEASLGRSRRQRIPLTHQEHPVTTATREKPMTCAELRSAVKRLPRLRLAHLPTPLEELATLSKQLGGPRIFVKRDDCTGMVMGGNKTRHNEFLFAHALEQKAEMFVWGAGVQSNNCRQTAAACAKLGLGCHLVLSRHAFSDEVQGNLLIDHLVGANVEIVDTPIGPGLFELMAERAAAFRKQGRRVYCWENEVVKPRAAVSYLLCLCEIVEQMAELGLSPGAVYACSSGSTGAGLALAKAVLGLDVPLRNIAPIAWPWNACEDLAKTANAAAELLGLAQRLTAEDIDVSEEHIGPGYGIPSAAGDEALTLLARTEGLLLDPVYTAKAMSALIDDVRHGRLTGDRPAIFIHTGGTPALFAYRDAMLAASKRARAAGERGA